MPTPNNVADLPLPGKVLEPNDELFNENPGNQSPFGNVIEPPTPAKRQNDAAQVNDKRFEYWQSQATKATQEAQALKEQLEAVKPMMPLLSVLQRDAELQNVVKSHLSGKKPLEAPQRPESYNEVEAFSNPDSASFKYRVSNERYKDERINQLQQQFEQSNARQQQEFDRQRQQQAQAQAQQKFQEEVVQMGIPPAELPQFYNLVQSATPKDMVEFYQWKNGQSGAPRFDVPSPGFPSRQPGAPRQSFNEPVDISADILEASRILR